MVDAKSSLPDREPDYSGSGSLHSADGIYPVVGQVWLPRAFEDQPVVQLYFQHFVSAGPHELELKIHEHDESAVRIIGHSVWLPLQSERRYVSRDAPDAIRAIAEPEMLRVVRPFKNETAQLVAELSDNLLLRPIQTRIHDIEVGFAYRTREKHVLEDASGNPWTFLRQLSTQPTMDGKRLQSQWTLYAQTNLGESATHQFIAAEVIPALEGLVHLAAFASNQRTTVLGWEFAGVKSHETVYRLKYVAPELKESHTWNDVLIQRDDLTEFVRRAISRLRELDSSLQRLLSAALIVAVPDDTDYLESRFLSLFSAIESALLVFRRKNNLEYLVRSGAWKRVQKALHAALESERERFDSAERLELAKGALTGLRRVPLEHAFSQLVQHYDLPIVDLWPLAEHDSGISLLQLRNRLSHGERLPARLLPHLMYASHSLQTLVQRVVLALFGWPIERSACRPEGVAEWAYRLKDERSALHDLAKGG